MTSPSYTPAVSTCVIEKAYGVHGDGVVVQSHAARHIHARNAALEVCVGQKRKHAVGAYGTVVALRAVACGKHVFKACMHALIHNYAAVDVAARLSYELGIGAHAYGHDEDIESYLLLCCF